MIGKAEGRADQWHGHVSAVTVAPQYRRMGISSYLMDVLEKKCDAMYVQCIVLFIIHQFFFYFCFNIARTFVQYCILHISLLILLL